VASTTSLHSLIHDFQNDILIPLEDADLHRLRKLKERLILNLLEGLCRDVIPQVSSRLESSREIFVPDPSSGAQGERKDPLGAHQRDSRSKACHSGWIKRDARVEETEAEDALGFQRWVIVVHGTSRRPKEKKKETKFFKD